MNTSTLSPEASIYERTLSPSVTCSAGRHPRQAWLETLKPSDAEEGEHFHPPLGMVDLHPDVFAVFPRLDLIHKNLYWQAHYRMVDWRCITTRAELPYRSNRKPWPQKGTGRARHGNRRTHIWVGGGQCKGPRGPESFFFILPRWVRLNGLLSSLSVKFAQNDLHIVDSLHLSDQLESEAQAVLADAHSQLEVTEEQAMEARDPLSEISRTRVYRLTKAMNRAAVYLRSLVDARRWGPSVLFVTDSTPDQLLSLPSPGREPAAQQQEPNPDTLRQSELSVCLASSAYAHHIEMENSPEASAHQFEAIAPRALHPGRGLTVMPVHSLNVWSLLHHDSVVISLAGLEQLESRLLRAMTSAQPDSRLFSEGPGVQPMPSDWLAEEELILGQTGRDSVSPHFSGPVGSADWLRGQMTGWK